MNIEEIRECFYGRDVPSEISSLLEFVNNTSKFEYFSEGFQFSTDKDKHGLKTYSEDDSFLNSIIEFASADGEGSSYGLWLKNNQETPVVAFGSEGGFHVVANDLNDLFIILTFDIEPMIEWDQICYFKDSSDYEPSSKHKEYCDWLKNEHKLDITTCADSIVKKAQSNHKDDFDAWVGKFYQA